MARYYHHHKRTKSLLEPTQAYWKEQILKHQAVEVDHKDISNAPIDKAIAFETRNFGWILSAKSETGYRKILLKF
jgi:hypothetical protein